MNKIEKEIEQSKIPELKKLQRKIKENKNPTEQDLKAIVKLKTKDNTVHFKNISREKRIDIYSNKTNPPPVGHYRPKLEAVEIGPRDQTFNSYHKTAE